MYVFKRVCSTFKHDWFCFEEKNKHENSEFWIGIAQYFSCTPATFANLHNDKGIP